MYQLSSSSKLKASLYKKHIHEVPSLLHFKTSLCHPKKQSYPKLSLTSKLRERDTEKLYSFVLEECTFLTCQCALFLFHFMLLFSPSLNAQPWRKWIILIATETQIAKFTRYTNFFEIFLCILSSCSFSSSSSSCSSQSCWLFKQMSALPTLHNEDMSWLICVSIRHLSTTRCPILTHMSLFNNFYFSNFYLCKNCQIWDSCLVFLLVFKS